MTIISRHFRELSRRPLYPGKIERHTHRARMTTLKSCGRKVANESLERTGDEGLAIREANAVVEAEAD